MKKELPVLRQSELRTNQCTIYRLVETRRKLGINPSGSLLYDEQEVALSALSIDDKQLKEMRESYPRNVFLHGKSASGFAFPTSG